MIELSLSILERSIELQANPAWASTLHRLHSIINFFRRAVVNQNALSAWSLDSAPVATSRSMFASSEPSSLGAIQAIESRGLSGKIRLITFDFSDAHVEALKNGTIDLMLIQEPFRLGYEAVKSLVDRLAGKTPVKRMDLPARGSVSGRRAHFF